MKRVVVTGLGADPPVGNDVPTMWRALLAGASGVGPITCFDAGGHESRIAAEVKGFDPAQYLKPKEITRSERGGQRASAASKQAAADAGFSGAPENPFRFGVVIG